MAGAKMLTNYPTSIIMHGMALNITVQSYDRSLDFGLMADALAMPDVRELADAITIAFDDLRTLVRPVNPTRGRAATGRGRPRGARPHRRRDGVMGKVARQVMNTAVERLSRR